MLWKKSQKSALKNNLSRILNEFKTNVESGALQIMQKMIELSLNFEES